MIFSPGFLFTGERRATMETCWRKRSGSICPKTSCKTDIARNEQTLRETAVSAFCVVCADQPAADIIMKMRACAVITLMKMLRNDKKSLMKVLPPRGSCVI